MYMINFELPAFFVSTFCLIYSLIAQRHHYVFPKGLLNIMRNQHATFLLLLIANIISSLSSVIGLYLTGVSFPGVDALQYFFHAVYFAFHTTLSVTFMLYILNVTGSNLRWKKWHYALVLLPYMLCMVLILTNQLTSFAFYMDENRVYHRGNLLIFFYACGALYVLLGVVFFLRDMKTISVASRGAVVAFIILAVLGIVLQGIQPAFLVELFAESLAFLVIMIVLEEKSRHIDSTTGLLNEEAFINANRRRIGARHPYIIVLIRLFQLEKYSRQLNARETDLFLRHVANFLLDESKVMDVYCYRWGNFGILLSKDDSSHMDFIERVLERFEREWSVGSLTIRMDAIATLIRVPEDIGTLEQLDDLLSVNYEKKTPGSAYIPIEKILESTRTGLYEAALRRAIEEKQLALKYQPIWSVKKQKTVSAEALLRVDCPELSRISPEIYIPIAEKTGLIREIGLFVFEEVCRFLKDERIQKSSIEYVELNLSVYQFLYRDLVSSFEAIRHKYGIEASQLNLEITETEATSAGHEVIETLEAFRKLGYTLSLDDFGTGYSNLIRMIESNYRNIKIDKSILWNVSKEENALKLLRSLMDFIKTLGADIIQEGVEEKEQLDLVTSCGCDYIQGYYFSKPVSQEEFIAYLDREEAKA